MWCKKCLVKKRKFTRMIIWEFVASDCHVILTLTSYLGYIWQEIFCNATLGTHSEWCLPCCDCLWDMGIIIFEIRFGKLVEATWSFGCLWGIWGLQVLLVSAKCIFTGFMKYKRIYFWLLQIYSKPIRTRILKHVYCKCSHFVLVSVFCESSVVKKSPAMWHSVAARNIVTGV